MAATRSNNTFLEALAKLNHSLADMKLLADADLPFIVDMETKLLERARNGEQQMQQQGMMPTPPMNPMGAQSLGMQMPPGLPPIGAPMGGGMPGGMPPPGPPPGMAAPLPTDLGAGGVPGVPVSPNALPAELTALMA